MTIETIVDGDKITYKRNDSVNTPGFQDIKASGAFLPAQPHRFEIAEQYSQTVDTYNGPYNEWGYSLGSRVLDGGHSGSYTRAGVGSVKIPKYTDLEARVESKLLNKVRSIDLDLGIALGEYHETAMFVRDAMLVTSRAIRSLRRGDIPGMLRHLTFGDKKVRRKLRDIPDFGSQKLLAFNFGFTPLANDVVAACKLLEEGLKSDPVIVVHSSASEGFYGAKATSSGTASFEVSGDIRCHGKLTYSIDDMTWYTLEQLGLTNPAAVVWELVPLSFVVDWFLPIGNFIRNIQPPQGVSFLDGWTYTKAKGVLSRTTDYENPSPGLHTVGYSREKYKQRKLLNAFPTPKFTVPDLSISKGQVASAMALLWQRTFGR